MSTKKSDKKVKTAAPVKVAKKKEEIEEVEDVEEEEVEEVEEDEEVEEKTTKKEKKKDRDGFFSEQKFKDLITLFLPEECAKKKSKTFRERFPKAVVEALQYEYDKVIHPRRLDSNKLEISALPSDWREYLSDEIEKLDGFETPKKKKDAKEDEGDKKKKKKKEEEPEMVDIYHNTNTNVKKLYSKFMTDAKVRVAINPLLINNHAPEKVVDPKTNKESTKTVQGEKILCKYAFALVGKLIQLLDSGEAKALTDQHVDDALAAFKEEVDKRAESLADAKVVAKKSSKKSGKEKEEEKPTKKSGKKSKEEEKPKPKKGKKSKEEEEEEEKEEEKPKPKKGKKSKEEEEEKEEEKEEEEEEKEEEEKEEEEEEKEEPKPKKGGKKSTKKEVASVEEVEDDEEPAPKKKGKKVSVTVRK